MKKRVDEKIADALNISISEKSEIEPLKETAIEKPTEDKEKDYRSVRGNLHSIHDFSKHFFY